MAKMEKNEFQKRLKKFGAKIDEKKKVINPKPKPKTKTKKPSKFTIIPGEHILLKEIDKIKVYKYPNESFSKEENDHAKILLFIGNAKDDFINTFINVYTDLPYNEENRLSIETNDNKNFICYDITSRTKEKNDNIKIYSIPHLENDNTDLKKNIIELFEQIPRGKIHLLCFAFDENKAELNDYEKIFYRFFINLLNLRDKILFLISSKENSNSINNYSIHNFLNSNDYFIGENGNIKPDYIEINNQTIFEMDESNYRILMDKMKIIRNKINLSTSDNLFKENKISIFNLVFFERPDKFILNFNKYKNEKMIILFYLMDLKENFGQDLSQIIKKFYNKIKIVNNDYPNLEEKRITCIDNEKVDTYIHILSRLYFLFNNIEVIQIENCKLKDYSLVHLESLFSLRLKKLYLNNNKISDLNAFSKRDIYKNLQVLDLSFNNISNIAPLSKRNFNNLNKLNLKGNKIKEGLTEFTNNFINKTSEELILEIKRESNLVELVFNFSKNLDLEFSYFIENRDYNEDLKNSSFTGITKLSLKSFNNDIGFLCNKTLQNLKILNLISNNITDLSMFNDIKFTYLNNINIFFYTSTEQETYIPEIPIIENNFNSLSFFKLIKPKKLEIYLEDEKKYKFHILFTNPELNIYFHNIDFLFSDVLINTEEVSFQNSLFDIDGNSTNIFSYENLKNRKLSIFKNIKCEEIYINYEDNIYKFNVSFSKPILNLSFNFNHLSFFEHNNGILSSCKSLTLSNLTLNNLNNYNSLEKLVLNNVNINNIDVVAKITSKFINFTSENLTLEIKRNDNFIEIVFDFSGKYKLKFNYITENRDYNEDLKKVSFEGIKNLDLKGFNNNIHFLSNKTLENLKILNIFSNDISDLSIFDDIIFNEIEKICIFSNDSNEQEKYIQKIPLIENNFNSLSAFKLIKPKKLVSYLEDGNKYKFQISFINPELNIYFNDVNFFYSDLLINTEELSIHNSIFDIDGNSTYIFSYENLKNRKLPIFKDIISEKININYEDNIYKCNISFSKPILNLSFNFNDLSFFEHNNEILSRCKNLTLSNLTLNNLNNYNSLEKLVLNNVNINNIDVVAKITSKFINFTSENLTLEIKRNDNFIEIVFDFSGKYKLKFNYITENRDYNEDLKKVSFEGIKNLDLKGFNNNIHFLSNKTLENLKILNIFSNDISDLSIFDDIIFNEIEKICIFSNDSNEQEKYIQKIPLIENNFNSLSAFKSIKPKKLEIYLEDEKKYKFQISFTNPELNIYFNDENFLYSKLLINTEEISIHSSKVNIDGNSTNIFSYEDLKNRKFPFFEKIICEKININYEENKYIYNLSFSNPIFNLSFNFNDLSVIENNNYIISSDTKLILSNLTLNNFEKFNTFTKIELNNVNINNIDVLQKICKKSVKSNNVICNKDLLDDLENYDFEKKIYFNTINYKKSSFSFDIIMNKIYFNDIKSLKNCTTINLGHSHINENGLAFLSKEYYLSLLHLDLCNNDIKVPNFLSYNSLKNLKELNLLNNKIEDISYFIEENIKPKNITKLILQKNQVRKGLEVLKQEFFDKRYIYAQIIKINKINDEYLISVEFKEHFYETRLSEYKNDKNILTGFDAFKLDFYIKDLNDIWNILDKRYTFFKCNPTLFKRDIITGNEFDEKKEIFNLLLNFSLNEEQIFDFLEDTDDKISTSLFKLLYDKGYRFFKDISIVENFRYFSDIKSRYLSFDSYTFTELFNLSYLNLSDNIFDDIRLFCVAPFINLKKLVIDSNKNIRNLYELKNAKFFDLEELSLINCGLEDLNKIEMEKYPFKNLIILDLRDNDIMHIEPIFYFTKHKFLNLSGNKIFHYDAENLFKEYPNCTINLKKKNYIWKYRLNENKPNNIIL